MDAKKKEQLIRTARRVLWGKALEDYINFVNNFEIVSKRNDEKLKAKYKLTF